MNRNTTPVLLVTVLAICLGLMLSAGAEIWAVGAAFAVVLLAVYVWGLLPQLFLCFLAMRPLADVLIGVSVGGLSPGEVWGVLALAMELLILADGRRKVRVHLKSLMPVLVFLGLYLVLVVARSSGLDGVERFAKIAVWMLTVPVVEKLVVWYNMRRSVERAGYALAVFGVFAALLMAAGGEFGTAYYGLGSITSGGTDAESQAPHAFGTLIVLSVPFVLLRMQNRSGRSRIVAQAVLVLALLAIGLSLVRSVILAVTVLFLVLSLISIKDQGRSRMRILIPVALAAGAAFISVGDLLLARVSEFGVLSSTPSVELGSGRVGIWGAVARGVTSSTESFLIGRGPGAAVSYVREATGMAVGAHNDILELAADGGILLLGAYLAVVIGLVWSGWRRARTDSPAPGLALDRVLIASACAFGVLALTNGALFYMGSVAFGLLLGLVIAVPEPKSELADMHVARPANVRLRGD